MSFSDRSATYRKNFFAVNRPVKQNKYRCVYCGMLFPKSKITVDHLYPVSQAKKSVLLRSYLRMRGYKNINDIKNLVPACEKCNKSKGKKGGIWIIRGTLGRHEKYWRIRKIIYAALFTIAAFLIYKTKIYVDIYKLFTTGRI